MSMITADRSFYMDPDMHTSMNFFVPYSRRPTCDIRIIYHVECGDTVVLDLM